MDYYDNITNTKTQKVFLMYNYLQFGINDRIFIYYHVLFESHANCNDLSGVCYDNQH